LSVDQVTNSLIIFYDIILNSIYLINITQCHKQLTFVLVVT